MRYSNDGLDYQNNRWATLEEFAAGLHRQKMEEKSVRSGVPLMVEQEDIYVDDTDSHTLIYGNTGSKKTRNFCIPTVYALAGAGESMVIADPKGEIYRNTSGYLQKQEYHIQVINLRNMKYGCQWNPLTVPYQNYCQGNKDVGVGMVVDFCQLLAAGVHNERDPFWELSARELLEALILILFEIAKDQSEVNMSSVKQLRMQLRSMEYDNGEDGEAKAFWDFLESFPPGSLISFKLANAISLKKVDRTFNCVLSTLDGMLNQFIIQQELIDMMWYSDVDFKQIGMEKTAVYLLVPDEKRSFHFLVSVFVKQCYEQMITLAQWQSNLQLPKRVNFILDEFSNFPRISDMPSMISAARSRNIRFMLVVQSKQQLFAQYEHEADTIRSNCRNWIYLASREIELLEEMERICGYVSPEGEGKFPLISVTGLQRLKIGRVDSQALVLCPQIAPFISWVKDFEVYPQAAYEAVPLKRRKQRVGKVIDVAECFIRMLEEEEGQGEKEA